MTSAAVRQTDTYLRVRSACLWAADGISLDAHAEHVTRAVLDAGLRNANGATGTPTTSAPVTHDTRSIA